MTTPQGAGPARRGSRGAGFAGLTVSTALGAARLVRAAARAERQRARTFGAGIVMWRNAMLSLEVIGVAQSVREHGVRPDYYEDLSERGVGLTRSARLPLLGDHPAENCTRCWRRRARAAGRRDS